MSDITGYQPRAQAAALVRVRGRGPRSHKLRRLLDRWLKARAKDRDLTDELRARDRGFRQALAERDEALADLDEAEPRRAAGGREEGQAARGAGR